MQHPDGNPDAAYVSCLWSEKFENGEAESYEVVWVLRRESAGWRVAGMATQLADSEEPVFLDFEDLTAMENAVQKAEAPRSPQRADAQAQASGNQCDSLNTAGVDARSAANFGRRLADRHGWHFRTRTPLLSRAHNPTTVVHAQAAILRVFSPPRRAEVFY